MTETATAPAPYADPNDFLMGGGDGVPGAKLDEPGATVEGIVLDFKARQIREYNKLTKRSDGPGKVFPSGDPIMGILVDLQTTERDPKEEGDTGVRRLYVESKNFKQTLRDAIQLAGGKGLEKGARLSVNFTHRDDPMDKQSAKNYTAVYTTAANVQMMGGAPAAAPVAAPVAAYVPPVAQPAAAAPAAQQVQLPTPVPQSVPAPAPAAAMDPVSQARALFTSGLSDAQIAGAVGLDVVVIAALRAQG